MHDPRIPDVGDTAPDFALPDSTGTLRRISELCGLDLRTDDWLMIEIAVKLVRLKQTLERDGANTSGALRV